MKTISGKVIWITGASSGIGEALSYELCKMGNTLILSARNEKKLQQVSARCSDPSRVFLLPLDISATGDLTEKVSEAISQLGTIDILINNAGISQRSLIANTKMEVYQRLMEVNYLGTIALTKAILPHFVAQKKGYFVTVTSLMGRFGSPLRSGYCGAKHALHGFFDVLRMEHEKDGINVTLVCPGFVRTNVAYNALTADGSPQQVNDQATSKGMPADTFARKMIDAMARGKYEVHIGGKEVMGIYLKRFLPRILHRVVLKSEVV
jgi:short-subunit dehydrogenase